MRYFVFLAVVFQLVNSAAFAQETFPKYLTFSVKKHPKLVSDTDLAAMHNRTMVDLARGQYEKLLAAMTDEIEIFRGKSDPANVAEDGFVLFKRVKKADLFRQLAMMTGESADKTATSLDRAGKFVFRRLLVDPDIGINPKLGKKICTGPVGVADEKKLTTALKQTKSRLLDWRVAKKDMAPDGIAGETDSYEQPLSAGQMVWQTPDDHRDSGWTSVVDPKTGKPLNYQHQKPFLIKAPFFSLYINQHVCFLKTDQGWKISAIAVRI